VSLEPAPTAFDPRRNLNLTPVVGFADMVDPLSISTSILTLAAATISLIKFVKKITEAPVGVEKLRRDIQYFRHKLISHHRRFEYRPLLRHLSNEDAEEVRGVLEKSTALLHELMSLLRSVFDDTSGEEEARIRHLAWARRQKKCQTLCTLLEENLRNLEGMIGSARLLVVTPRLLLQIHLAHSASVVRFMSTTRPCTTLNFRCLSSKSWKAHRSRTYTHLCWMSIWTPRLLLRAKEKQPLLASSPAMRPPISGL
jgi:hypothetical protein